MQTRRFLFQSYSLREQYSSDGVAYTICAWVYFYMQVQRDTKVWRKVTKNFDEIFV